MPPLQKYSRNDVLEAALTLMRQKGPSALNARSVAKTLGSSTQPLFRLFTGMDELQNAVICRASKQFFQEMFARMDASDEPHIAMGMCYLTYARQEPQLFKLLFLRDRITAPDSETEAQEKAAYAALYARIARVMDTTSERAALLFSRAWLYTHGLATAIATKYSPCLPDEEMERLLHESWASAAFLPAEP